MDYENCGAALLAVAGSAPRRAGCGRVSRLSRQRGGLARRGFRRAGSGRVSRLSRSRKRILDFMLQKSEEQGLNVFGICRTKNHMIDTRLRGRKDLL